MIALLSEPRIYGIRGLLGFRCWRWWFGAREILTCDQRCTLGATAKNCSFNRIED